MKTKKLLILFGIISLLVSISTWGMDLFHLVATCVYCRNERTVMGLLGILMLLPKNKYLTSYFALALGFYGTYVAADQVFSNIVEVKIGLMLFLAICALGFIVAQVFFLVCCLFQKDENFNWRG